MGTNQTVAGVPDRVDNATVRGRRALEPGITTVVAADESGKGQLLGATKRALIGKERSPVATSARHSAFFAAVSFIAVPEFGLRLSDLAAGDRSALHSTRMACRHSQIAVTMDIYSQVASASTTDALRRLSEQLERQVAP